MSKVSFLKSTPRPGDGACLLQNATTKHRRNRHRYNKTSYHIPIQDDASNKAECGADTESGSDSFLRPAYDLRKEQTSLHSQSRAHEPRTIKSERPLSSSIQYQSPSPHPPRGTLLAPATTNTDDAPDCNALSSSTKSSNLDEAMALPPHLRPKKAHSTPQTSKQPSAPDTTTLENTSTPKATDPADRPHHDTMPRKTQSNDRFKLTAVAPKKKQKPDSLPTPPSSDSKTAIITEKLRQLDLGIKVTDPKPAGPSSLSLVPYPSSNESDGEKANVVSSKPTQATNNKVKATSSNGEQEKGRNGARQQPRRGGRGGARGGAFARTSAPAPQDSKWPKHAEMAADPHRWDTKWDNHSSPGSIDSVQADSGHGGNKKKKKRKDIDSETGWQLTGWDGDWAPAPMDWDSRPAFRDNQSAKQIYAWRDAAEDAVVGLDTNVPTTELTAISDAYPEVAPHYWVPLVIGNQAPQTFWNELLKSTEPKPTDEGDLDAAMPWWELYESSTGNLLQVREQPTIEGIDPDENRNERLARENDLGSDRHTENRKNFEKAKRDAEREKRKRAQEKSRKISKALSLSENRESIKPAGKIYLRSAKPSDMKEIRDIYNHYVTYSVCTPEIERRTLTDMEQRYHSIVRNRLPFLVACERGERMKPGRNKKNQEDEIVLPDKVLGFATADDYNDMLGMYRFTVEVELFVHNGHYMKGLGKCLLDKMMGMLDPMYIERGGYDVEGEELEGIGSSRVVQNVLVNMPYETEKPVRLDWIGRWLTNWIGFSQVADLPKVGLKDGKFVNLAVFHRGTGVNIDPTNPPISTQYPK